VATVTSTDGTAIAFESLGSGPAVILVDGAMCFRDAGPMRGLAEQLAGSLHVILYDRRGRGASTDTRPFSVAREVEDLDALITAAGGSAALFGMSSGGALALTAAESLGPERVPRLAVYEPPFLPEPMLSAAAEYTHALTAALDRDDRDAAATLFLRRVGVPDAALEGMRSAPGWDATLALAPTLAYDDAALEGSGAPVDRLRSLRIPLLALAGGQSPEFLRFGAVRLAEEAADGAYETVENQTHDVSAEALAPHLIRFFVP
jgi:pimeloyl-ACP methyl ester carboxylesterase